MSRVPDCPRCGNDHDGIVFRSLGRPVTEGCSRPLTHWTPCPSTGEPILAYRLAQTWTVQATVRVTERYEGEGGG